MTFWAVPCFSKSFREQFGLRKFRMLCRSVTHKVVVLEDAVYVIIERCLCCVGCVITRAVCEVMIVEGRRSVLGSSPCHGPNSGRIGWNVRRLRRLRARRKHRFSKRG